MSPLRRLSATPPGPGQYAPIGSLSRQVTLYLTGQRDATSGAIIPPDPFGPPIWASIRALQGQEIDKAQQIAQAVSHLITISYQLGIQESMLVGFEGRMFQIKYVEDIDERHVQLLLFCDEVGQNAGQQK